MSRSVISRRVKSGELIRLLPEIYATEKPDYKDLCRAVALWKPNAVASHTTAAWLWGLIDYEPQRVEFTIDPSGQSRSPDWVRIYRRTLPTVATYGGFRVVAIEQAFVDVAAVLPKLELEKFFDAAIGTQIPWRRVAEICDVSAGMKGMAALREQLRRCCPGTSSEPERIVARALTARNFRMKINARVGPFYGDLVDFRARVIVEIDGREFHSDPATFNNDRRRQNTLVLDGWLVLRYSAATVLANLDSVVDEIITVVRRRRKSINSSSRTLPRN
ncbi:Very-short-patch-repair endonuclease [Rhodococcoides kyotonense]|uniref:Very-short-patch-repair endonuclease n=2 Tax=Rhodococcoides kyotonense TaxID=398843 RepID=A0A239EEQ6_9NOCA|nr:Very-short-patch-repair endonuclease [Rhodococcus kyotonensis]